MVFSYGSGQQALAKTQSFFSGKLSTQFTLVIDLNV